MSDSIREQFKLLQRAKKMETMGNSQRALEMYLELHEKYDPNTSDAYERPAILLERFQRYQEAKDMCLKAIEGIHDDTISGTIDKFEKRLKSINDKMQEETVDETPTVSYHFHILGFYKSPLYLKVIFTLYYLLAIGLTIIFNDGFIAAGLIGGMYGFTFLFEGLSKKYSDQGLLTLLSGVLLIAAFYSILQWPQAFKENIIFTDTTESLEGAEHIFNPDDPLPLLKAEHLDQAIEEISRNRAVTDALILVNENDITLGLILYDNTSSDEAKALLGTFAKILNDIVAEDNALEISSKNNYGGLYNFFHLDVTASDDGVQVLAKGSKNTKSKYIIWE